jgi:L-ascorbate metabolism protein UlaG (beta-lactamase superfamily)
MFSLKTEFSSGFAIVKPTSDSGDDDGVPSEVTISELSSEVFMDELAFHIPNAITSPKIAPAKIAKKTSLRIDILPCYALHYMKLTATCQVKKRLLGWCEMEITHLGHSFFKLKTKHTTLVTDPFNPSQLGIKYPITDADVITISHPHPGHNFIERIRGHRKILTEPGEYEVSNLSIIGLPSYHDDQKGDERGTNTIFIFEAEELRIAHLGDLGHKLSEKMLEEIGDINVLMINSGHPKALSAQEAAEIVRLIEPEIILPMHYKRPEQNSVSSNLESVDTFLKAVELTTEKLPKLSIKITDLSEGTSKIVLLETKG